MHTLNRVVKTSSYHKANVITDLQRLSVDGMVKRSVLLKQSELCTQISFSSGADFCLHLAYFLLHFHPLKLVSLRYRSFNCSKTVMSP